MRWRRISWSGYLISYITQYMLQHLTYRHLLGLCLCGFPLHVGKCSTKMPLTSLYPFCLLFNPFSLIVFAPNDMEIFMIPGMGFKAWLLWVSVRECFRFCIWKKMGAVIQVILYSRCSCVFSVSFYFLLLLVLCMNNNKKIRCHTAYVILLIWTLTRYLTCSLNFKPLMLKSFFLLIDLESCWNWTQWVWGNLLLLEPS